MNVALAARLCRARAAPTRLVRRAASGGSAGAECSAAEGPSEGQQKAATVLKAAGAAWLTYNLCRILWGADTFFIAPSLTLVKSHSPENRDVGVDRLSSWHASESALTEVIAQGGAEALLSALPAPGAKPEASVKPQTTVKIVELLVKMAPLSNTRDRLDASVAAPRAAAACASLGAGDEAARCRAMAATLAEALGGEARPAGTGGSGS